MACSWRPISAWRRGLPCILLPKFDIEEIFRALPSATVMMGVPTFYVRLLQDPRLNRETAGHMRLFVSGSAPLLAETHREWSATHRPGDPGTLWHDRNQHEHLQSL